MSVSSSLGLEGRLISVVSECLHARVESEFRTACVRTSTTTRVFRFDGSSTVEAVVKVRRLGFGVNNRPWVTSGTGGERGVEEHPKCPTHL